MDLAGPFPPDLDGHIYAIMCVDVFSKWVEVGKLPSKRALRTGEWFYQEVISRWGKPQAVRVDNGGEWYGEFCQLLNSLDIKIVHSTVGNSRANGQAERMIRTFKDIVQCTGCAIDGYWSDALPMAV